MRRTTPCGVDPTWPDQAADDCPTPLARTARPPDGRWPPSETRPLPVERPAQPTHAPASRPSPYDADCCSPLLACRPSPIPPGESNQLALLPGRPDGTNPSTGRRNSCETPQKSNGQSCAPPPAR